MFLGRVRGSRDPDFQKSSVSDFQRPRDPEFSSIVPKAQSSRDPDSPRPMMSRVQFHCSRSPGLQSSSSRFPEARSSSVLGFQKPRCPRVQLQCSGSPELQSSRVPEAQTSRVHFQFSIGPWLQKSQAPEFHNFWAPSDSPCDISACLINKMLHVAHNRLMSGLATLLSMLGKTSSG